MIIEIEALDTVFFRDGKPFEKSDDVWATGMFPPLPGIIYGALRSAYLGQNDISLDNVREFTRDLRIKNIWYLIKGNDKRGETNFKYLPMPLELVQRKNLSSEEKFRINDHSLYSTNSLYKQKLNFPSSAAELQLKEVLSSEQVVEGISNAFITDTELKNYLKGKGVEDVYQFNPKNESKTGIARSNQTRTTSEGNLYRVGMLRTPGVRYRIEIEGLNLNETGILQFGAEKKLARYQSPTMMDTIRLNFDQWDIVEDTHFKLYLSTPAIFKNGYYPVEIFKKAGIEVELLSCAVGKYLTIGGFDLEKNEPKRMMRAVPAGSVYYFSLKSGKLSELDKTLRISNICEERPKEGFGIAYIGKN